MVGRFALDEKEEPYLGFLPHVLDEVLKAGSFEPEPIRRLWLDRGWLKVTKGKHQYRTRIGGNALIYVVAIEKEAIDQVEGPAEEDEEEQRRCPNPTIGRAGGGPEQHGQEGPSCA